MTLVYILVAFTDLVACSFVGTQDLMQEATIAEAAQVGDTAASVATSTIEVPGAAIASSSLLYLAPSLLMGLLLRYTSIPLNCATAIFLPLVAVAIWVGRFIPLDSGKWLGIADAQAVKVWDVLLLGYSLVAGVLPVW